MGSCLFAVVVLWAKRFKSLTVAGYLKLVVVFEFIFQKQLNVYQNINLTGNIEGASRLFKKGVGILLGKRK